MKIIEVKSRFAKFINRRFKFQREVEHSNGIFEMIDVDVMFDPLTHDPWFVAHFFSKNKDFVRCIPGNDIRRINDFYLKLEEGLVR